MPPSNLTPEETARLRRMLTYWEMWGVAWKVAMAIGAVVAGAAALGNSVWSMWGMWHGR